MTQAALFSPERSNVGQQPEARGSPHVRHELAGNGRTSHR
ncbi:hypothetical protein AK36_4722 [Burkholderia vietnamiensis LMG 10929]|nr:hypothetical protein AK36_4722 [Burkholderia vietnamiensis LMG 10929]